MVERKEGAGSMGFNYLVMEDRADSGICIKGEVMTQVRIAKQEVGNFSEALFLS